MKKTDNIKERILPKEETRKQAIRWRLNSKSIVFTNGVFDILHEGHIALLARAATYGDVLVVGVNSDASVKKLKGDSRPVNGEQSRALLLASLIFVDAVVIFNEETPIELIKIIKPDVLVKGGDYTVEKVVGATEVLAANGKVAIVPLEEGFSTTSIIERITRG